MSSADSGVDSYPQDPSLDKAASYLKEIARVLRGEEQGAADAYGGGLASRAASSTGGTSRSGSAASDGLPSARSGCTTARALSAVSSVPHASSCAGVPAARSPAGGEALPDTAPLTLEDSDSFLEDLVLSPDASPFGAPDQPRLRQPSAAPRAPNGDTWSGNECFVGLVQYLAGVLEGHHLPEGRLQHFRSQLVTVIHKLCRVHAMLQLPEGEVDVAGGIQGIAEHEVTVDELSRTTLLLDQGEAEVLRSQEALRRSEAARGEQPGWRDREELHHSSQGMLQDQMRQVSLDYDGFFAQVAGRERGLSPLARVPDLAGAEILSLGQYGHLFVCQDGASGEQVVLKALGQRWVDAAVKEWAHATSLEAHPHIVSYRAALMHRDVDLEILHCLDRGLAAGTLRTEQALCAPDSFVCLTFEHMDSGSLQDLLEDAEHTPLEWAGAVVRQVASALAFLHGAGCSHNGVGPCSILLRSAEGGCLVAKLADGGALARPADALRDAAGLASTAWRMASGRAVAPRDPVDHAAAVAELASAAEPGEEEHCAILRETLAAALGGLWSGSLAAAEAAALEPLLGCELRPSAACAVRLEARAREALAARCLARWERRCGGWAQLPGPGLD